MHGASCRVHCMLTLTQPGTHISVSLSRDCPASGTAYDRALSGNFPCTPWYASQHAQTSGGCTPQKLVRKALRRVRACHGGVLRFQTINGSLWVHHDSPRPEEGWWPSHYGPGAGTHCTQTCPSTCSSVAAGMVCRLLLRDPSMFHVLTNLAPGHECLLSWSPGWVSGKGRIPLMVLALMDLLREFPGQVRQARRANCGRTRRAAAATVCFTVVLAPQHVKPNNWTAPAETAETFISSLVHPFPPSGAGRGRGREVR